MTAPEATSFSSSSRHLLAQFGAAGGQVGDEQVGQRLGVGPDAGVGRPLVRQLPDQEDQGAELVAKLAVVFLLLPGDRLGDFLQAGRPTGAPGS